MFGVLAGERVGLKAREERASEFVEAECMWACRHVRERET